MFAMSPRLEVPTGFGPMIIELQSIALPTWLRNHHIALKIIPLDPMFNKKDFNDIFHLLNKIVMSKNLEIKILIPKSCKIVMSNSCRLEGGYKYEWLSKI